MLITLIPLAVIGALIAFWLWMFNDMLHNEDIPVAPMSSLNWPPQTRSHWTIFFILLSIFTAGYYYFAVYRER